MNPLPNLCLGHTSDLQGESYIAENSPGRQQVKMLKNHADFLPGLSELPLAQGCHVDAVDQHLPFLRPFQHINTAYQGALAGTAETDDAEDLAGLNMEIDIIQGPEFPLSVGIYLG